jgi:hypothetical protein
MVVMGMFAISCRVTQELKRWIRRVFFFSSLSLARVCWTESRWHVTLIALSLDGLSTGSGVAG